MKNRYYCTDVLDLGPSITILDSVSKRKIRHVYVVRDSLHKNYLHVSENTFVFLIAKELNTSPTSVKMKNIWRTIKSAIKSTKQTEIMMLLRFIELSNQNRELGISLIERIAAGKPLTQKQLDIVKFKLAKANSSLLRDNSQS